MATDGLQAIAHEIERQPEALERLANAELPKAPRGSIFVGAGDSYASALAGFYASDGRCLALDPYSLAIAPDTARGLDVFFISISGRTSSNVFAAKKVRRLARETTALTGVEESPLARNAGRVIRLPISYVPKLPGVMSFSLSALAAIMIAGGGGPCDFSWTLREAKKDAGIPMLGEGTTYMLGNSLAYPPALYAAAKIYELLGARAHGELLEEFSHMELFSLRKRDAINLFSDFDPSGMARKLTLSLAGRGYNARLVPARGRSRLERFFHCVFLAQLWSLAEASKAGLEKPRFLMDEGKLHVSDSMIY